MISKKEYDEYIEKINKKMEEIKSLNITIDIKASFGV